MSWEVNKLLDQLPPYRGEKTLLVGGHQKTSQIIDEILGAHKRYGAYYDRIAPHFWQGSPAATAEYLYTFAKQHLPYKAETSIVQTVKKPQAILAERYDFRSDCKHYASFCVGVGEALRRAGYPIKCFYRFGIYNRNHKTPGHVFAVFMDNGRELWVDPIPQMKGFNARNMPPLKTIDKMPPMTKREPNGIGSVYEISGVPWNQALGEVRWNEYLAGGHDWYSLYYDHRRRSRHEPSREPYNGPDRRKSRLFDMRDRRMAGDEMGKLKIKIKVPKIKPGELLKKFGGAPSRNAFLLLVKLNTFHLATKMWKKAAHDKNSPAWKTLADKWRKLGGKPEKLYREIQRGVNTYNKLHKAKKKVSGTDDIMYMQGFDDGISNSYVNGDGQYIEGTDESIGAVEDITGLYDDNMSVGAVCIFVRENHRRQMHRIGVVQAVAAAGVIAAAAPVIKALMGVLKAFGIDTKKAKEASDQDTKDMAKEYNDAVDKGNVNEDGSVTTDDGKTIKVTDNGDGTQKMEVKKQPGLSDQDAADQDDDGGSTTTKTKTVTKTKTKTTTGDDNGDSGGGFFDNIKQWVGEHKVGVAAGVGGLALIGVGASMKSHKGNYIKPVLMLAGVGALGYGGYKMLQK